MLQATRDAHLVFALLNDRTGLKRQVFQRLERGKPGKITSHLVPITEDDGVDYANIQRQPWGDPPSSQNFFDLMDQAENLALELIRRFQTGDFARLTRGEALWIKRKSRKGRPSCFFRWGEHKEKRAPSKRRLLVSLTRWD